VGFKNGAAFQAEAFPAMTYFKRNDLESFQLNACF